MQRSLVPDLFTKSSSLDMRSQNKINCLLPTNDSAEESLVQENNCKEIAEAQTILNKSPIMVAKSVLLIEIGFGRHTYIGFFMVSVVDSAGSCQGLSPGIVLCCWGRHSTLTLPLSTQVFKWVPEYRANLIIFKYITGDCG